MVMQTIGALLYLIYYSSIKISFIAYHSPTERLQYLIHHLVYGHYVV